VGLIILTLLGLKYLPGWVKLVWLFHAQFYLCNDDYQTFAEKSAELMRIVEHLTEGDELYIGGIIDFHF